MILNFRHPAMADTHPSLTPAAAGVVRLQAAEIRDSLAVVEAEIDAVPDAVRGLLRSRLAKAQRELSAARKIADRFARPAGGDEGVA